MRSVLCAEGPIEPQSALTTYLVEHPPTPADPVHLVFGMRRSAPVLPAIPDVSFTVGSFLPGRGLRDVVPLHYHRCSYSEICRALADGSFAPDVLVACATPPDSSGSRSLGGVNGYLDLAVEAAGTVVIEEVAWLPRVPGATMVPHADKVVASDARETDEQPHFSATFDETDIAIAGHILPLIPSSPRLALGIGRVSDALAHRLAGRGDVDILTGVVTDAVRAMHAAGTLSPRPIRAMSVVGTHHLLRWAEGSGAVELLPSTNIHQPSWLASHDRFVSVLGAIQVDAVGNINSERIGNKLVSGRGGAPDFALGGHLSQGGLSIVALHSTDRQGRSRLVPELDDPSIPAARIDAVVTENGVALLAGLESEERRSALSRIF
jgi:4-hydroxybutyrate CoA-transferase